MSTVCPISTIPDLVEITDYPAVRGRKKKLKISLLNFKPTNLSVTIMSPIV